VFIYDPVSRVPLPKRERGTQVVGAQRRKAQGSHSLPPEPVS